MKKIGLNPARKATAVGMAIVCALGMVPIGAYANASDDAFAPPNGGGV